MISNKKRDMTNFLFIKEALKWLGKEETIAMECQIGSLRIL